MYKLIAVVLLISLFATGCEKAVDFKLDETATKVVVEATIENGKAPLVFLSSSTGYFSTIDPQLLASSFIHNAVITISNGVKTHTLKEYTQVINSAGYKVYYYTTDTSSLGTAIIGQLNESYNLRIAVSGKEYAATTTIPTITKKVDSLWWRKAPAQTDSSKVIIMVKATDAPGFGDYVRYFTKRNNEPFFPPFNSVFDDLVIDGTSYELQVDPGFDRNNNVKDDDRMFKRGDTVTLKLCNIDKANFDFWRTMEFSYASVGNPFASPVKVLGNINNGALGYFGGYACQYHTLVIPK